MTSPSQALSVTARERIVAVWAGAIGAARQDLRKDEWIFVARPDLDAVVVVRVDGFGLVAAPPRVLDAVRRTPREVLLDAGALSRMLPGDTDPIGTADLLYAERSPHPGRLATRAASSADLSTVRDQVSSAEWEESGVEEMDRRWAVEASEGRPAAISGFESWRSEFAQMGVIASPQCRHEGAAYAAAAAATQEALNDGLIAQWRSRQGNEASLRLAHRLGYICLGAQSTVVWEG